MQRLKAWLPVSSQPTNYAMKCLRSFHSASVPRKFCAIRYLTIVIYSFLLHNHDIIILRIENYCITGKFGEWAIWTLLAVLIWRLRRAALTLLSTVNLAINGRIRQIAYLKLYTHVHHSYVCGLQLVSMYLPMSAVLVSPNCSRLSLVDGWMSQSTAAGTVALI